jgi:hypothetical protein
MVVECRHGVTTRKDHERDRHASVNQSQDGKSGGIRVALTSRFSKKAFRRQHGVRKGR